VGSGLAPDPTTPGGMWAILLHEGLAHWDGKQWRQDHYAKQLPSTLLWTAYTDPGDGSLWIGSEAGVSRFDGVTWGALSAQDGLQSPVIYAIARGADGGYWLGGRSGLSYFLPDTTPPQLAIGKLSDAVRVSADGSHVVTLNQELFIDVHAGDLQTTAAKLTIWHRLKGPAGTGEWQPVERGFVPLRFSKPGDYSVEFLARDQSFNYSEVAALALTAVAPPVEVAVPVLGRVETGVFRALVALGSVALLGASYITFEVLSTRRRGLAAVARSYNPYISGEPVRRDDMFFGRRDLVQRIVDTLHNNSIMIYGERRIGKTTLLHQLGTVLREVDDAAYWFVPIFVDLEGTRQETFFHFLMEEILAGIESLPAAGQKITPPLGALRVYSIPGAQYGDRDFNRDLNKVMGVLEEYGDRREAAKQLRVILLMDEMDVMSQYDSLVQQQLRRIFMREFAATLGAVVAGIQISKDWDRVESPWFNMFNEIALIPFSREQGLELLTEPVRGYYHYEPAAVEFILERAYGRPYKIQQYGLEAVNHMLAHRRRRITLADAEAAHQRIQAAELERREQATVMRALRYGRSLGPSSVAKQHEVLPGSAAEPTSSEILSKWDG
jgi:hypothetical protein